MQTAKPLFSYRPYWAHRFGPAPFLPMSRDEMEALGWDSCDIVLVTGDAYVDHPSFGMAIIGRLLEAQGFRVGIIAQPDWHDAQPFKALGKPNLFFGVTSGNMDSMVNRYTADRRLRHNDSYTPGDEGGKRPDRAVIVYAQRCREAFRDAPIVIGGIEASLRRIAHYDYWSDKVRRSILVDSKADLLVYGNAERAIVEIAHRLAKGARPSDIRDVRGTAYLCDAVPADWTVVRSDTVDEPVAVAAESLRETARARGLAPIELLPEQGRAPHRPSPATSQEIISPLAAATHSPSPLAGEGREGGSCGQALPSGIGAAVIDPPPQPSPARGEGISREGVGEEGTPPPKGKKTLGDTIIRLPAFDQVTSDLVLYAHASRVLHLESNPGNARPLVQRHGDRELVLTAPPIPLETAEMDGLYDLPYARAPHPFYGDAKIAAWDMIRFSINIMRGCFGGCSFCSITEHEGRIIQSRSEDSILREVEAIRDKVKGFTGIISDLGGPTANMYRMACKSKAIETVCRRPSCVFPDICKNLNTDHDPLISLYRKARAVKGVKKIHIASGLRYDLAVKSPAYVKELVTHHVGGYLKIAPEHTEEGPLQKMMKPGIGSYDRFKQLFDKYAKEAGKELYLIPYFIAAHPGTSDEDMMNLALWLKRNRYRADQVQTFLPSPMSVAAAMYHTERNTLRPIRRAGGETVFTARGLKQRRLHKAFLRYHDAENWPVLREALKRMGRADLIGPGKHHLVPAWQPAGTGLSGGEGLRTGRKHRVQKFVTQQTTETRRPGLGRDGRPKR